MEELGLYLIFMRDSDIWGEDNDTITKAWSHRIQSITLPNWGFCSFPSDIFMLFFSHGNCSIIPSCMKLPLSVLLKNFIYIFPYCSYSLVHYNRYICECTLLFHSPTLKIMKSRPEYSSFLYACNLWLGGSKDIFVGLKWKGFLIKYERHRSLTHIPTIILFINLNLFFFLDVKTKIDGMFIIYRNYAPNQKLTSFDLSTCWNS